MYLSRFNPGFDYSTRAYSYDNLPQNWFDLINNLPAEEYESFLDYRHFIRVIATWYDINTNGFRTELVDMGISLQRRDIYARATDNASAQPIYFTFYGKPFDIKSSFYKTHKGEPYGVINLNHRKQELQQLRLIIYIGDEVGIERYNTILLLFAFGDCLLKEGYKAAIPFPVYCKSFASVCHEIFDIDHIPSCVFDNVHCLNVETDGRIVHKSVSKISMTLRKTRTELIEYIHELTDIGLKPEYNWDNRSRENIVWSHLDLHKVIRFDPIIFPFYNMHDKENTPTCLNDLTFESLYKCKRIGFVPKEKKIITFGSNHFERFEFQLETDKEMLEFGKVMLSLQKLYTELNNYFADEEGLISRVDNENDIGFFLKTSDNTDESFFIDLDTIGDTNHTYHYSISKDNSNCKILPMGNNIHNSNAQTAFDELDSLIGLGGVKKDVKELANLVNLNIRKNKLGLPMIPVSLHLVFTGNPGTGKTTVARILADIYKKIGVLSKGQLVEVDRSALVAGYVGQTALKTQAKIQEAMGGILFIDEAYTLAKDGNDFGQEAIDTILKAMEDNRGDLVVIVAGYPELMKTFINSNPGLRSRFNKYIVFEDYSTDELYAIFMSMCKQYNLTLNDSAEARLRDIVQKLVMKKDENFANARDIRNIFEKAITKQANRIAMKDSITESEMLLITEEDFG